MSGGVDSSAADGVFLAVAMGNGASGGLLFWAVRSAPLVSVWFVLMSGMLGFEALRAWQPCAGRRALGSVWGFLHSLDVCFVFFEWLCWR